MAPTTRASRKRASEMEKEKPGQPYPQTKSARKAAKANGSKKASAASPAAANRPSRKRDDSPRAKLDASTEDTSDQISYWLMKSEPESRFENGQDIKFSIDDLAATTAPEGWDGKCTSSNPFFSPVLP